VFPLHAFDRFVARDVNVSGVRIEAQFVVAGTRVKPPSAIVAATLHRRCVRFFQRFLPQLR
jgi:hypothetical protein